MVEFGHRPSEDESLGRIFQEGQPQPDKKKIRQRVQELRDKYPVAATLVETVGLFAANTIVTEFASRHGLNLSHGRENMEARNRVIKNHPILATALLVGVAPAAEELAFRKIPSDMLDKRRNQGKTRWDVGTGIGLPFLAMHAGKDGVGAIQFGVGEYLWWKQRKRGYKHALLSHATYNTLYAMRKFRQLKNK